MRSRIEDVKRFLLRPVRSLPGKRIFKLRQVQPEKVFSVRVRHAILPDSIVRLMTFHEIEVKSALHYLGIFPGVLIFFFRPKLRLIFTGAISRLSIPGFQFPLRFETKKGQ